MDRSSVRLLAAQVFDFELPEHEAIPQAPGWILSDQAEALFRETDQESKSS